MTGAALEARLLLWEWLAELDDPDAEQRAWKAPYLEGMLLACERSGLLDAAEIAEWRALARGGDVPPPGGGDVQAAAAHLEALLAALSPMSREAAPDALHASRRFHDALAALHAAGLVDDGEQVQWLSRALAAEAPWLEDEEGDRLASFEGFYAVAIPPRTPEEEAADAEEQRRYELMARRGAARRVLVPARPERFDGLAILAVVARTESTEVHFHHVGGPLGDQGSGRAHLDAFTAAVDALDPPTLTDDAGTAYEPAADRPASAHGTGGMPDPARPAVVTGYWRYHPAAPTTAGRFTLERGAGRWTVGGS